MKTPRISTVYPFNYKDMIDKAKFMFINPRAKDKPYVVMEQDEKGFMKGFSIDLYRDGIEQHSEFSMGMTFFEAEIDKATLTTKVNDGILKWLSDINHGHLTVIK